MKDLFAADPTRFDQYSISTPDLLFDYSKNIIKIFEIFDNKMFFVLTEFFWKELLNQNKSSSIFFSNLIN